MVDRAHLCRIEKAPPALVEQQGIVVPAIPQRAHDIEIFMCPRIAVGMVELRVQPEIARLAIGRGGHAIPSGTPAADLVERGEFAGEMVRREIGRRHRRNQADLLRHRRKRRQKRQGFKIIDRRDLLGERPLTKGRDIVGQEQRIELRRLRRLGEPGIMRQLGQILRMYRRMQPRGEVVPHAHEKGTQFHLPRGHAQNLPLSVTPKVRGSPSTLMKGLTAFAAPIPTA
ncbi:hypothetical protein D9M73_124670 [compost metagenome]